MRPYQEVLGFLLTVVIVTGTVPLAVSQDPPATALWQKCVHPYLAPNPQSGGYECDQSACGTAECAYNGKTVSNFVGASCTTTTDENRCRLTSDTITLTPELFECTRTTNPSCPPGQFQCFWVATGDQGQDQGSLDCEDY